MKRGDIEDPGFTANPRDLGVFNKTLDNSGRNKVTVVVNVDDLLITCKEKSAVLQVEQLLLKTYGQFRITANPVMSYLGCTWDFSEPGFVSISQRGLIQDF